MFTWSSRILGVNRTEGARINKQDLPVGQVTVEWCSMISASLPFVFILPQHLQTYTLSPLAPLNNKVKIHCHTASRRWLDYLAHTATFSFVINNNTDVANGYTYASLLSLVSFWAWARDLSYITTHQSTAVWFRHSISWAVKSSVRPPK